MGLVVSFGVGVVLATLLNCRPLAKSWDPLLPGSCGSLVRNVLAISVINMVVDLIIILLPILMVWRLQMATWRKVALTFIFALGLA